MNIRWLCVVVFLLVIMTCVLTSRPRGEDEPNPKTRQKRYISKGNFKGKGKGSNQGRDKGDHSDPYGHDNVYTPYESLYGVKEVDSKGFFKSKGKGSNKGHDKGDHSDPYGHDNVYTPYESLYGIRDVDSKGKFKDKGKGSNKGRDKGDHSDGHDNVYTPYGSLYGIREVDEGTEAEEGVEIVKRSSHKGVKGSKGNTKGTKGNKGDTKGTKGDKGDTKGTKGDKGDTKGNKGDKGGTKGTKGDKGHVKGTKGHMKGTKGNKGHVKGTKGNKGHVKGTKGDKGWIGGTKGGNGTQGMKGNWNDTNAHYKPHVFEPWRNNASMHPDCNNCVCNAKCVQGICMCKDGFIGDPLFVCYKPHYKYCRLVNDPGLQNFQGERVILNTFGSFKTAQMITDRYGGGTCDFCMDALTGRYRGKTFIRAIKFKLKQFKKNGDMFDGNFLISASVNLDTGVYNWEFHVQREGNTDFVFFANITSTSDVLESHEMGCIIRGIPTTSQFLKIQILCCGIQIGLRTFNPHDLAKEPGLWIIVNSHKYPRFPNWKVGEEPVCLDFGNFTIDHVKNATCLANKRNAMTYLALTNKGSTNYDHAPPRFGDLRNELINCNKTDVQDFFNSTRFMFDTPPFIRCLSQNPGQGDIVELIWLAALWVCGGNSSACMMSKDIILNGGCSNVVQQYPPIQDYINMSC